MDFRRAEVSEWLWSHGGPGITVLGLGLGLGLEAGKASRVNDYATPDRPHCCVMLQEQIAPRSQWLTARVYFSPMLHNWPGPWKDCSISPSDQWLPCHPTAVPSGCGA